MNKRSHFLIFIGMLLCASKPLYAAINGIGGSAITKGLLNVQLQTSYSLDEDSASQDNRFRSRIAADYGFTDDVSFTLAWQGNDPGNDNFELDAWFAETRLELTNAAESGFYSGLRFRYTLKDGDKKPDDMHVRYIVGKPIGKWDIRLNQILYYEVGPMSRNGIGFDTRLQSTYLYHPNHRLGLEYLSNFGAGSSLTGFDEQNHEFGPVLNGRITDDIAYETGYRYGLSDAAADHSFKIYLSRNF